MISSRRIQLLLTALCGFVVGAQFSGAPAIASSGLQSGYPLRAAAAAQPVIFYAGVQGAGLFETRDPSAPWTALSPLPQAPRALAAGSGNGWHDLYAATEGGIQVSHNAGKTWTGTLRGHTTSAIYAGAGATGLFAGTESGIYRSDDDGATWSLVLATHASILNIEGSRNTVFASDGTRVWESNDDGDNWNHWNRAIPRGAINEIAIDSPVPHALFAATSTGLWHGVGGVWTLEGHGIDQKNALHIVTTGGTVVVSLATGNALYISTDGGATWNWRTVPGLIDGISALAQDPEQGASLAIGDRNGAVRTSADGGADWSQPLGTVAGIVGNPVIALTITHRRSLPIDGVDDPHQPGVQYTSENGGHTVRGPFLTFWRDHSWVGIPETEEFTDTSYGGTTAQIFQNVELLQRGSNVFLAPLGRDAAGHSQHGGYKVDSLFLSYWESHSGRSFLGPPVSTILRQAANDGSGTTYPVQYFRGARLEYHAELGTVRLSPLGEGRLHTLGWL